MLYLDSQGFIMLFLNNRGVIGYSTVGSDVIRTGLPADNVEDDEEDISIADSTHKDKARRESPPSYNDHCELLLSFFILFPLHLTT